MKISKYKRDWMNLNHSCILLNSCYVLKENLLEPTHLYFIIFKLYYYKLVIFIVKQMFVLFDLNKSYIYVFFNFLY